MEGPKNRGVFLQRVDEGNETKILGQLAGTVSTIDESTQQPADTLTESTYFTLSVKNDGDTHNLTYGPWDDVDVNSDNMIDDRDEQAMTELALSYYHQITLKAPHGIFLYLINSNHTTLQVLVQISKKAGNLLTDSTSFTAISTDGGSSFTIPDFSIDVDGDNQANHDDKTSIERLVSAFTSFKL
ncbi:hypothetical protein [Pseudomonas sp. Irchel 3E20]|uniref:hypothetical protein n=1 Tax=Pseudomonas sp. Irchel 3E20 TaxID=2008983 RepID=UPI0011405B60|nr:hypothetical protein [Pseudomonas sp. Irchel 3E20]